MSTLVYTALTAVIFTSAAGALVMCLLVFKYGFAPSPDELPSDSVRRVFITRLGHALAGTCFAATAILAAVTLADLARRVPPTAAALPANDPRGTQLAELTLGALMSRIIAAESGLQNTDERVRSVEAGLRRVGDDVRKVPVSDAQAARPRVAAPLPPFFTEPRVAFPPAPKPVAPTMPSTTPPPPIVSEPRVASPLPPKPAAPAMPNAAPPPSVVSEPRIASPPAPKPAAPAISNTAPPPPVVSEPRVVSPPAPKPAAPAISHNVPQPTSFAEPRAGSPVVPQAARPVPPKSPAPDDLGSRLRRDWDAIKRGFTTAPSEFGAALEEQGRALRDAGK